VALVAQREGCAQPNWCPMFPYTNLNLFRCQGTNVRVNLINFYITLTFINFAHLITSYKQTLLLATEIVFVRFFLQQNQNYLMHKPDYPLYWIFSQLTLRKRYINGHSYEIFSKRCRRRSLANSRHECSFGQWAGAG
jgi:hypothetical protein